MTPSSLALENGAEAHLGVVFSKSSFSQTAFLICVENEGIGLTQRFSELQALLLTASCSPARCLFPGVWDWCLAILIAFEDCQCTHFTSWGPGALSGWSRDGTRLVYGHLDSRQGHRDGSPSIVGIGSSAVERFEVQE